MNNERKGWWLLNGKHLKNPSEGFQVAIIAPTIIVLIFVILTTVILFPMMAYKAIFGDLTVLNTLIPAIAGLFAAPFLIWKLVLTHKQTITNEAKKDIDREVAFTNLYTKSVELLGATREVKIPKLVKDKDGNDKYDTETRTAPNMEVRLGALYALKKLAKSNTNDQTIILNIICAYIRLNSWYNELGLRVDELGENEDEPEFSFGLFNRDEENKEIAEPQYLEIFDGIRAITPREDIVVAIDILGNRKEWLIVENSNHQLDLSNARLSNMIFCSYDFSNTEFLSASLISCTFIDCCFNETAFNQAKMNFSTFIYTDYDNNLIVKCDFEGAELKCSNFHYIQFKHCSFQGSELHLSHFFDSTFYNCYFQKARLDLSKFEKNTFLSNPHFSSCHLWGAQFLSTKGIKSAHIESSFGDIHTIIPKNIEIPNQWKSSSYYDLPELKPIYRNDYGKI